MSHAQQVVYLALMTLLQLLLLVLLAYQVLLKLMVCAQKILAQQLNSIMKLQVLAMIVLL